MHGRSWLPPLENLRLIGDPVHDPLSFFLRMRLIGLATNDTMYLV